MAFSNAENFVLNRPIFTNIQGNYNEYITVHHDGNHETRNHVYAAMKDYVYTEAFHNSGARRETSRCYPGTREVALKAISSWIGDRASHCLWLHGPAGTGKSAIAQTVAEQCHRDGTLGASYFFVKGSATSGPPPFFSTLAYQLIVAVPGLHDDLWAAVCADPTVFQRSPSEQLDKLIVQPFLKLVNRPACIVIVIDGLDECDCTDGTTIQGEIVRLILGLEKHSLPLRFLISSRPEPEIRRAFESAPSSLLAHLRLDKTLYPDRDIRHFLCSELGRIYQQSVEDGMLAAPQLIWPPPEAVNLLVRKASGHFIYASTVIRFVQEEDAHPVERLDLVLKFLNEFTNPVNTTSIAIAQSAAFRDLDQLYLYILRKAGNPVALAQILRAIMYFGNPACDVDMLDALFCPKGGARFLLRGLHSIVEVTGTVSSRAQFLHASLRDFVVDPARSCEFHLDLGHFEADLACEYTRLIILFSPAKPRHLLLAMGTLKDCLLGARACPGLLSATLERLSAAVAQGPKFTLPCLCYSGVNCLLRILKEVPESDNLRKKLKTILCQLEPQLAELSDKILVLMRVLGVFFAMRYSTYLFLSPGQFIGVPNGEEIVQHTLNLNYNALAQGCELRDNYIIRGIYQSLSKWFFANHQPKKVAWKFITPVGDTRLVSLSKWLPTHYKPRRAWGSIPVPSRGIPPEDSSWAWACDAAARLPHEDRLQTVHHLDHLYCCLRVLIFEFDQPLNDTLLIEKLNHASRNVACCRTSGDPIFLWVLDGIDFTPVSQALSTLRTELSPRLSYLIRAFDGRYRDTDWPKAWTPSLQRCLQDVYSHLMQDPVVSCTTSVIYAMFERLPSRSMELLFGFAPGELFHSAGMEALFGDVVERKYYSRVLRLSTWLPLLLKQGLVKFQHVLPNTAMDRNRNNNAIADYICHAHERLTIVCSEFLRLHRAGPVTRDNPHVAYAMRFWKDHLMHAKHSERLFETLRRVVIRRGDIDEVIEWLERSADTPEVILLRWRAARLEYGFEYKTEGYRDSASKSLDHRHADLQHYSRCWDAGLEYCLTTTSN